MILRMLLALALAGPTGCIPTSDTPKPEAPDSVELRSYAIPSGYGDTMQSLLQRALRSGDGPVGRVTEGPGNTILVLAPASVQAGVTALVDSLPDAPAAERKPAAIELRYWLVKGESADGGATHSRPPQLAEALTAIEQQHGSPLTFELVAGATLTSNEGDHARSKTGSAEFRHTASLVPHSGEVLAQIEIEIGDIDIETRVQLSAGQTVVLAQLGDFDDRNGVYDRLYAIVQPTVTPGG